METLVSILEVGHFPGNIIFLVCLAAAVGIFVYLSSILRKILRLARPEPESRIDQLGKRVASVLYYVFGQARVLREAAGVGHFLIFWCFILLVVAYVEEFIMGIYHGFSYEGILAALFGAAAAEVLYGLLMLLVDILCPVVFVVLCISLFRRYVQKPLRLRIDDPQARKEATIIIGLIMSLMVLTLLLHGAEGARRPDFAARWMPVGNLFSGLFEGGVTTAYSGEGTTGADETAYTVLWWVHSLIILYFLTYLPRSKHMHLLGAIPNVFTRSFRSTDYLPRLDLEDESAEAFGVNKMEEYTWRQLLDGYACTECGRCQAECPAFLTDKPLTPFGIIHHLKLHTLAKGKLMLRQKAGRAVSDPEGLLEKPIVPDVISEEAVMACTTCGACMEECPVFIEHIPKIVDLRRYLVLTEGKVTPEEQQTFRNMETQSNPWGIGAHQRGEWAEKIGVKTMAENSAVEYLYFVGCAGSFDDRNKKVASAVARILRAGDVSFAILGAEEGCCGDSARRLGNEYLFQMMASANIETLDKYGVKKIITSCPHGYVTLRNDYAQFGGDYEVYHHTQIMARLMREGRLKLTKRPEGLRRIAYHDPCYLGRHSGLYAPPREVLDKVPGLERPEMPKSRRQSFCCGGGGGRMWLEETIGKRVNFERTEQVLELGPDGVAVACPFCLTMFDEGVKTKGVEETCRVMDISEIVAECLE